ncbi:MAG: cupin domain-containing protein [Gemmatimonadetes bacterium]|nr:cupin domain-containing protein [Gemmatimonadota bacterium]
MRAPTILGLAAVIAAALVAWPGPAQEMGQGPMGFKAMAVLQATTTASRQLIAYPTGGTPEITALLIEIAPGGQTGLHKHPTAAPFVYVLEGTIEVQAEGEKPVVYSAGGNPGFVEVFNTWHNGINKGDKPAKLLVVFPGLQGQPNLVRPETKTGM